MIVTVWTFGEALDELGGARPFRARIPAMAAAFLAALAATFLNPFGWHLHFHALAWAGSETVQNIAEFQPLIAIKPEGLVFMAVTGLLVLGLAAQKEWVGWKPLLVTGVAFFAALAVTRNVPLFGFLAVPVLGRRLTPAVSALPRRVLGPMREEFARSDAPGWRIGAGAAGLLLLILVADGRSPRIDLVPDQFSADVFPAAAVDYAREEGLEGRLSSEYTWGGYCCTPGRGSGCSWTAWPTSSATSWWTSTATS